MNNTGTAFTNHNPECTGIFFFLSKQPPINKSLDLPMGSDVNAILTANAMVTTVITEKKMTWYFDPRNHTLDQSKSCDGNPGADLRMSTEMTLLQLPFESSATVLSSDFYRE